jgi:hypothetical protein
VVQRWDQVGSEMVAFVVAFMVAFAHGRRQSQTTALTG